MAALSGERLRVQEQLAAVRRALGEDAGPAVARAPAARAGDGWSAAAAAVPALPLPLFVDGDAAAAARANAIVQPLVTEQQRVVRVICAM